MRPYHPKRERVNRLEKRFLHVDLALAHVLRE